MNDNTERQHIALKAGFTGMICNLLLFLLKFFIGFSIHSLSILADSFNNLSDMGSAAVSAIGSRMAGKKADEDHPFGHGRIEYITAFIVSILILSVGLNVLQNAFCKILHPEPVNYSRQAVWILLSSILVKIGLGFYYRHIASLIDSGVYAATAQDSFSDALITGASLCSLLLMQYAGINMDAYIGLLVALFVIVNGIQIAKNALAPLIGESIDPEQFYTILHFVEHYAGILGAHDLIIHNYGPEHFMASIHVEVDGKRSVSDVHAVIDDIEKDCKKTLGIDLVIHMDPVDEDDISRHYRHLLTETVGELSPVCSFHDFHMKENAGDDTTTLFFDLVTPWNTTEAEEKRLLKELRDRMVSRDPHIHCDIKIDKPYMHVHSKDEDQRAKNHAETLLKRLYSDHEL